MSTAGNSSEANGDNPSNMHSTSQGQINHVAQPIQSPYWIPGNNNMGCMGMPYGYYGYPYMPPSIYDMSAMMSNSLMPFGSSNFYNAPTQQSYPPYQPIQHFPPQMLMPPPAAPMFMYNPMLAGNQRLFVDSNHTAYPTISNACSTQSLSSVPTSMNDGVLENPTSRQDSANEPLINGVSQNSPSTDTSSAAVANVVNYVTNDSPPLGLPQKDTNVLETENSSSTEKHPEVTDNQSFSDNLMPTDKKSSEQDAEPQPLDDGVSETSSIITVGNSADSLPRTTSTPPSTPTPKTLDCSSNASPTRASETSMSAAVPESSAAFTGNTSADTTKTPHKRRYSQCDCPYCKADDYDRPRFPDGSLQHICRFRNCGRKFHRPAKLEKHIKWHGDRKYFCAICLEGFARKVELSTHIESCEKSEPSSCQAHNSNCKGKKNANERGQYVCKIPNCGKVFKYAWVLRRHLRWHDDKNNFICQYCDRGYALERLLKSHVEKVHKSKPSKPQYMKNLNDRPLASCSVREADSQEIDSDFNLESNSSKYVCTFAKCNKAYMSFNRLKEHTKCHFGVAPYICLWPSCGKEFTRSLYLHLHEVIHTGEKKKIRV